MNILNTKSAKFTKIVLDIMFYGGLVVLFTLPISLKILGRYYSEKILDYFILLFIVFGICGIFGILIICELRKMMKTVLLENCFVYDNVASLKKMTVFSAVIAAVTIVKLFILPTPATAVIVLVFFIAALFSKVLAHVFEKAVNYKEENDLTI